MEQKDRFFSYFMIFTLIVGVIFGKFFISEYPIVPGFNFIYKFLVVLLFLYTLYIKRHSINKLYFKLLVFIFVYFGFMLIYSFLIGSNDPKAILLDFNLLITPFIIFCTTVILVPDVRKSKSLKLTIAFGILCNLIEVFVRIANGSMWVLEEGAFINSNGLYTHTTGLSNSIFILALLYLYIHKESKKHIIYFLLILCTGLFAARSKFFGICALSVFLLLFFQRIRLQLSVKNIVTGIILLLFIVIIGYSKINTYFVEGAEEGNLQSRLFLYLGAAEIFRTYVPFGSGIASFASPYTIKEYYSPIYYSLGMDKIRGLTPDNPIHVGDAFFPILAEFGIIGVFLFFYFFYFIVKKTNIYQDRTKREINIEYLLITIILGYIFINSIAEGTFLARTGHLAMIVLGLCMTDLKRKGEALEIKNLECK